MVVTLDAKRRLTVPAALAPAKPGDYFDAHFDAEEERLLEKAGQRVPVEDSYIAATARRHGLTIATGNDRDFKRPGLKIFNPFKELP